ncbi:hypothetical protein [Amphritea pacifica]|uniref:hypothetical protein n=1 Tax=Amphritea pacifica TaxID=2811233 RepID=UPI001962F6C2|nr:hypothetical protein [Amphritea pacifica]MBN1006593.1 hypothetical protein [Amphritea pacifica]
MPLRISLFIISAILTIQCPRVNAESREKSFTVSQQSINHFRQISVRILSAYKTPPRYIGSTRHWHLFLKKETRKAVDKHFSTIFGYKIPRDISNIENGWELSLPAVAINPDNCPEVARYSDDKTSFSLPQGTEIAARCISQ